MWKCLYFLTFLAVVLSVELPEISVPQEITSVNFLSFAGLESSRLQQIVQTIVRNSSRYDDKELVAELNEYTDELLVNLNGFITEKGLDPASLPEFEENFRWSLFVGWVGMYDGWLRGMATIKRTGDVLVKYNYPNIKIHAPLGFSKLTFDYYYEAKFMGLGPSGLADGKITGCEFTTDVDMNMVNLRLTLDNFKLKLGKVSLKFHGSVVGDIANVLIAVVMPILQPILKITLEDFITVGLDIMFGTYNNFICRVLDDCPEIPAI